MNLQQRIEGINAAIVTDHPDINLDPVKRIKAINRVTRCFELSGILILENPSWMLVHTRIFTGADRIEHAYLLKEGVIYDPVNDTFYNEEKLNRILLPENTSKYNQVQAAKNMKKYGHWGYWDSGPRSPENKE